MRRLDIAPNVGVLTIVDALTQALDSAEGGKDSATLFWCAPGATGNPANDRRWRGKIDDDSSQSKWT